MKYGASCSFSSRLQLLLLLAEYVARMRTALDVFDAPEIMRALLGHVSAVSGVPIDDEDDDSFTALDGARAPPREPLQAPASPLTPANALCFLVQLAHRPWFFGTAYLRFHGDLDAEGNAFTFYCTKRAGHGWATIEYRDRSTFQKHTHMENVQAPYDAAAWPEARLGPPNALAFRT